HVVLGAKFARNRSEDARADRLVLVVDQNGGVGVEADHRSVAALKVLGDAHDDGALHFALLHAALRGSFLDRHDDHVADRGVAALRATQHFDALDTTGAGVIGDVEVCLHLDHAASPLAGTISQRFSLERGGHSWISTIWPTCAELFSSCAW